MPTWVHILGGLLKASCEKMDRITNKPNNLLSAQKTAEFRQVSTQICRLPIQEQNHSCSAAEIKLSDLFKHEGFASGFIVVKQGSFGAFQVLANFSILRAALKAELNTVSAIIGDFDQSFQDEACFVDDILRGQICPLQEAEFHQSQIGKGSKRAYALRNNLRPTSLRNKLQLLQLSESVQYRITAGELNPGQARTIAYLNNHAEQEKLAVLCIKQKLSVRALEEFVHKKTPLTQLSQKKSPDVISLENQLSEKLGSKASIQAKGPAGELTLSFAHALSAMDWLKRLQKIVGQGMKIDIYSTLGFHSQLNASLGDEASVAVFCCMLDTVANQQENSGELQINYDNLNVLDRVLELLL